MIQLLHYVLLFFFLASTLVRVNMAAFILSLLPMLLLAVKIFFCRSIPTLLIIAATIFCWGIIFFAAAEHGRVLVAEIPPVGASTDELMFLKTFYLTRQHGDYYQSFFTATIEGVTRRHLTRDVLTWRMPTLTWLWSILFSNGMQIQAAFIFLSLAMILVAYFFFKKQLNPSSALLAGPLLMPYFLDGLVYRTSFLFHEWWGLFSFLGGLAFAQYQKIFLAAFFLSLAALIRELFVIPIFLLAIISLFHRQNRAVYIIPLVIFSFAFFLHRNHVLQFSQALPTHGDFLARFGQFDKMLFLRMIAFSMRQYIFTPLGINRLFLLLSILSLLIFGRKQLVLYSPLVACFFSGILLATMGVFHNDYWGVTFMPVILLYSVTILGHASAKTIQQ